MQLGEAGQGFKVAMATLDGGRIGIAAQALGIARAAYEKAVAYAKERTAFHKPIAQLQAIQFVIADMAVEIDAARLLVLRAAMMKDKGVRHSAESAMAKLYASEMSTRTSATRRCRSTAATATRPSTASSATTRDARITEIYEGTSEIQRIVIANSMLR